MNVASLAELLHEASRRHGAFEAVAPKHDWWDWYAAYMHARHGGASAQQSAETACRYMAEVKGVVAQSA